MLHIMQDENNEETYHAEYIRAAAEEAGFALQDHQGVSGLSWDDQGEIVDPEGVPIRYVWKTWAWETALDQLRTQCEEDDARTHLRTSAASGHAPRLVDVLLRPEVMVYEPFWTLILSNKAMLPLLWTIFPEHPYLLDSQFRLTGDLHRRGYVASPSPGVVVSTSSLFDKHEKL